MQPATLKKRYGIFSKLTIKTPKERRCFLMSPYQWGRSGGYSCTWICFNIYLSIIYFIWCTASYTMRRTRVPSNVKKGAQRSSELAFRSTDFRVPENLTYLALINHLNLPKQLHQFLWKTKKSLKTSRLGWYKKKAK